MSTARVVVLHGDPEQRGVLCSELVALGMQALLPADCPVEARKHGEAAPVELCIVDAQSLTAGASTGAIPANPFDPAHTPGILVAADASRDTQKAAAAFGYGAVLAAPVSPRLLYRRIGSLLQKSRRAGRANASTIAARTAARRAELRER
ncbi:MAG: hypothetical protein IT539_03815 [Bradyrhizobiaceae bacterium]|nr:hypothetical protein [Bradyrhizobiaceae bacterium]